MKEGHPPDFTLLVALALVVLTLPGPVLAQSGPDWSQVTTVTISTTDGPATQTFEIQTARVGDEIYFRIRFDYSGASNQGKVFFAIELAKDGNVTRPMSQGDEMLIISELGPDGKTPGTYDFYISQAEGQPEPITPSSITVHAINILRSRYEMIFSRPMATNNMGEQVQLKAGKPTLVAFAISEWGLGSSHAYTQLSYQMNITESQVMVSPYQWEGRGAPVLVTQEMLVTPEQALIEGSAIFLVLFASILYLGRRRSRTRL